MRLRFAAVSALVLGCGVLTACDDSDPYAVDWADGQPSTAAGTFGSVSSNAFPYTGNQVLALFAMPGLYLTPGERSDVISIHAAATEPTREAILARYGTFRVVIAHEAGAIRSLLSDVTTGQPLQPDARGIYWSYDPGLLGIGASWWALTRYANVVAGWSAGDSQRTDESWGRMTAELERLPAP